MGGSAAPHSTRLGNLGPQAKAAIPAVAELLKDDRGEVRQVAAQTLGRSIPLGSPRSAVRSGARIAAFGRAPSWPRRRLVPRPYRPSWNCLRTRISAFGNAPLGPSAGWGQRPRKRFHPSWNC